MKKLTQSELIKLAGQADNALISNKLKEAEEFANEILHSNRSAGLAYKGVIALRNEQYDVAEELLLESFQLNGKQNLALANLIPVYLKKRDFKKAVAFGEQAYVVMQKNQSVCINFAAALLQDQKFSKALEILQTQWDPEKPNMSIISGMISCYRSLFNKEEAEKLLIIAEKYFPDKHEIIRLRGDILAEKNPQEALAAFKKALEKDPLNVATNWNMSLVQLRVGDFEEGWKNYDYGLLPEVGKIGRPIPQLFEGSKLITNLDELDVSKWTFVVCEQGIGDQVLFLGVLNNSLKALNLKPGPS